MADTIATALEDGAIQLCGAISRISGGSHEVKFGELAEDDVVSKKYQSLTGTLKALKRRGLITYQGQMLLRGPHNSVLVSLTPEGLAVLSAKTEDEVAVQEQVQEVPTVASDGPPERQPMLRPAKVATGSIHSGAVTPTSTRSATSPVNGESTCIGESLLAESTDTSASALATQPIIKFETTMPLQGDPSPKSPRDSSFFDCAAGFASAAPSEYAAEEPDQRRVSDVSKDEEGKQHYFDMSYINHRTTVVENLDGRRRSSTGNKSEGGNDLPLRSSMATKGSDGKWKVDTSYINHRTSEVENLEAKIGSRGPDTGCLQVSPTVTKDVSGGWKVDTSYIGYRTGDPGNLTRRPDRKDIEDYADPSACKHPYEELKGVGNRPPHVDPRSKELYLADDEFAVVFEMTPAEFAKLPKWRQQNLKKAKDVF